MNKIAVIYVRVSDPSQIDNFSLDTQEVSCRKKAQQMGYFEHKIFREEGISAKTLINRPQIQEAIAFCKDKKNNVGAFVIYSYSRLSRDNYDFLTVKLIFKKTGISLISCSEPSGDSPENELFSNIISSINQFDNQIKARVVKANMKARFLQGFALGVPKFGYQIGVVEGRSNPVPKEPEFSVMRTIWARIADEKLSLRQVQKELVKLGYREIAVQTLHGYFSSKFYHGIIQSEQYGEVQGKHIPMIDEALYFKVREVLTGKKPYLKPERHHLSEDFPLRGTLICEFCSARLSGSWSTGSTIRYPYYYCHSRGKHRIISINSETTKQRYLDLLASISPKPNAMQLLSEMVVEQYESRVNQQKFITTDVSGELERLTAMRKELGKKHLSGIYTDKDYLELRDDLDSQITKVYTLTSAKQIEKIDIRQVMERVSEYFSCLDGAWDKAKLEQKNAISNSMFPRGVLCTKDALRTIELERIYAQTKIFSDQISVSTPSRMNNSAENFEGAPNRTCRNGSFGRDIQKIRL